MSDAWIYSTTPSTDLARALAELGFTPRHVARGLVPDGAPSRRPALAAIDGDARLARRLRDERVLDDVPLLLVAGPEELPAPAEATLVEELVVRPFSLAELATRVVRATGRGRDQVLRLGDVTVDFAQHRVVAGGREVALTHMEFALLAFLAAHPNRTFSRAALLAQVWGYDFYGGARTVDVHVQRVRAKLGADHAATIRTVRSVGYLAEAAPRAQAA